MINYHAVCDSTQAVEMGVDFIKNRKLLPSTSPQNYNLTIEKPAKFLPNNDDISSADLVFTDRRVTPKFFTELKSNQKVNRIPYLDSLTMKVPLAQALREFDETHYGMDFKQKLEWGAWATSIAPFTMLLPSQIDELKAYVRINQNQDGSTQKYENLSKYKYFIIKPNDGNQGNGIQIVEGVQGVIDFHESGQSVLSGFDGTFVVQPYIDNPMLYQGSKFDLRIYVILVGNSSLQNDEEKIVNKAYLLKSGFARICPTPYEMISESNRSNAKMHIATGNNFDTLESMVEYITHEMGHGTHTNVVWNQLAELANKVVVSFQYTLERKSNEIGLNMCYNSCFQLLGLDVMLDDQRKMWLLECNAKPCLNWERELDSNRSIGYEVNSEAMGFTLALGIFGNKPAEYDHILKTEAFQQRVVPLRLTSDC